ncbi:serine/threonine-protein kinase pim-2-like [Danio aesculapii]|uniref:serine/threonine-protein kinase pim-2-like n=1 Tax=Danio aesculapii TaxID=1142201 RepID=UPI0024BFF72F|nr:serine/threonine-protein kinase pim-2-like [Danio aesculapii]
MMTLARRPPALLLLKLHEWFWDEEKTSDGEEKKIMLVLEYPGPCKTLEDFLKEHEDLEERDARTLILQIVKAGQECLRRNICHYDMHDSNILVIRLPLRIKLIDFGHGKHMIHGKQPRTDTKMSSTEAVNVTVNQLFILIKEIAGHCSSIPAEFRAFIDHFYTLEEEEEDEILLPVEKILDQPWLKNK